LESDLFWTGDLAALALFDDAHEIGRIQQALLLAGIEPGRTPSEQLDF
jgi:hypothetical protein